MCPLVIRNDDLHVLFTLRSSSVGTHKGQVSFPGGHIDKGETAEQAAVRECIEELGDKMQVIPCGAYHDVIASKYSNAVRMSS